MNARDEVNRLAYLLEHKPRPEPLPEAPIILCDECSRNTVLAEGDWCMPCGGEYPDIENMNEDEPYKLL